MRLTADTMEIASGTDKLIVFPRRASFMIGSQGSAGSGEALGDFRKVLARDLDLHTLRLAYERWGLIDRPASVANEEFRERLCRDVGLGRLIVVFVPAFPESLEAVGDVTTFEAIAGVPTHDLEPRIGYERGRLSRGYFAAALAEPVGSHEFTWGDDTRYSGGFQESDTLRELATNPEPTTARDQELKAFLQDVSWRSMRADELRFEMLKRSNWNEREADAQFDAFMELQRKQLNVRTGPKRIVKLFPVIKHDQNKFWLEQYPDSVTSGTPQWTLRRRVGKFKFRQIGYVPPGGALGLH